VSNSCTSSPAGAQSLQQQIAKYNSSGSKRIAKSLRLFCIGENDLSAHTDAFWAGDLHNVWFAGNVSAYVENSVATLLKNGAPYVFVANIYPKHVAPVTAKYLFGTSTTCVQTW
jgi:hypothetical protein